MLTSTTTSSATLTALTAKSPHPFKVDFFPQLMFFNQESDGKRFVDCARKDVGEEGGKMQRWLNCKCQATEQPFLTFLSLVDPDYSYWLALHLWHLISSHQMLVRKGLSLLAPNIFNCLPFFWNKVLWKDTKSWCESFQLNDLVTNFLHITLVFTI